MNSRNNGKQTVPFLILTFALSSIFYFLIIKAGHLNAGRGLYVLGLMWCPGVAGMLTRKIYGQSLKTLGWKWGSWRYQVMSYLIPLAYGTVAYSLVWVFRLGGLYNRQFVSNIAQRFGLASLPAWEFIALYFAFAATLGVALSCVSALGEEIGWRGFLVAQLAKSHSYSVTALVSGIIWSIWRYPVLIFADYNSGTPIW